MGRNIVQIASDAADELSLGRDIDTMFADYNEGDTSDKKLRRAVIKTLDDLNSKYTWQCQRREFVFSWTSETEFQSSGWLAPDFLRFTPDTMHSRTGGWRLHGPISPLEWQNSRSFGASYWGAFRIANNELAITPYIGVGHQLAYEYVSSSVAIGADGSGKPRPTADTDTFPWDDETMTLGVIYHYRRMERLDYAADQRGFEIRAQNAYRMDGHARTYDMSAGPLSRIDALRANPVAIVTPVKQDVQGYTVTPGEASPAQGYTVPLP